MPRTLSRVSLAVALCFAVPALAADEKLEPGTIELFNGNDLPGWGYKSKDKDGKVKSFDGKTEAYGNRAPAKGGRLAVTRRKGQARWVAIACLDDTHWQTLCSVAGHGEWRDDRRFSTLADRLHHQDALDAAVGAWAAEKTAEDIMMALQNAGVPAGVCQNAEDRVDKDPQLRHLKWLTEVTGTKIGTWPIYELPMKFSRTPAYIGGPIDPGAPGYGEDNEWLLTSMLGMTKSDVSKLAEEGVI